MTPAATVDLGAVEIARKVQDMAKGEPGARPDAADSADSGCLTAEVFSPGRFGPLAFDVLGGWDLCDPTQRRQAHEEIEDRRPWLLVASPPCKAFSSLQALSGGPTPERLAEGTRSLEAALEFVQQQLARGGYFLFEHPWAATSWSHPGLRALAARPDVRKVRGDQCAWGQVTWGWNGEELPAQKATGWLTNCSALAELLGRRCPGDQEHQHLINGRAQAAETYPEELVQAVVKEVKRLRGLECALGAVDEVHLDEEAPNPTSAGAHHGARYYDEVTGLPLPAGLVQGARREEMEYMSKMSVFTDATPEEQARLWPLPSKFVDVDKGEPAAPNVRSRLVVCETRGLSRGLGVAETYSATPPHEALRMILSIAMSTKDMRLGVWDVSRAHLHSEVRREVLVRLPKDLGQRETADGAAPSERIVKLLRCCYGLRDASQAFDAHLEEVLTSAGFVIGQHCPCLAHADGPAGSGRVHLFRHGDDIVAAGTEQGLKWLQRILEAKLLIKFRGILGPDPGAGHVSELSILNRLVRWRSSAGPGPASGLPHLDGSEETAGPEQIELEADPRHVEVAAAALGLAPGKSNGVATPYVRPALNEKRGSPVLSEAESGFSGRRRCGWRTCRGTAPISPSP